MSRERRLLIGALLIGTAIRLLQTATSLGSLDALIWYRWMELVERVGVLRSYLYSELMNHPPLILFVAQTANRLGVAFGLEFPDSFRTLQAAADVVTAVALYRIAVRTEGAAVFAPLTFFLSPAAIFISAFHCNSDPLLMMCVTLAVAAAVSRRPELCGIAIAAATGVKVIALIVTPILFVAFRGRERLRLVAAAVTTALAIFLPGLIVSGPLFVRQIFGYTGMSARWGLRLAAELLSRNVQAGVAVARVSAVLLLCALAAVYVFAWRRLAPRHLPAATGLAFLLVLLLAPGFGVQYYFWILPFLAFAVPGRISLFVHAVLSVYLFVYYTVYAGGWPWWFAEPPQNAALARTVVNWGIVPWLAIALAVVTATMSFRSRSAMNAATYTRRA